MGCPIELISSRLSLYVQALFLDTHKGHISLAGGHGHMGHIWPKWPYWAIYGPYGHDHWPNQYARYGYPGKELKLTNSTVKISAYSDIQKKNYGSFEIEGQIYIVKMAVFDQFYRHRKEWSYRDFKDLFGNGMARGTKWEHVE